MRISYFSTDLNSEDNLYIMQVNMLILYSIINMLILCSLIHACMSMFWLCSTERIEVW